VKRTLLIGVIIALIVPSTVGSIGTSSAQQEGRPVLGVSCSVHKESYTPRDSLNLTVTLENRGWSVFYVYRTLEWGWAGLRFRLTDASGNIVPEPSHLIPPPPGPVYDKSQLVGLSPAYFLVHTLTLISFATT
jgi:hypothetical protein